MSRRAEDLRIRALRPPKPEVDPWRPLGIQVEQERAPSGGLMPSVTVFLAGSECPFTCAFCDLWKYTIDGPTPLGALPAQLRLALLETKEQLLEAEWSKASIKLYNASNFFDSRAVPPADEQSLIDLVRPFGRVIVECHPKLVGARCQRFAEKLDGSLEVAMGLETIHPRAFPRLNKGATLKDFEASLERLRQWGIASRAFVLLGTPYIPPEESVDWAVRSAGYAFEHGAETVALIPARGGAGELERLAALGEFTPPTLEMLEEALTRAIAEALPSSSHQVVADLWDIERLVGCCPSCLEKRVARMKEMNLTGLLGAPVACSGCRGGSVSHG